MDGISHDDENVQANDAKRQQKLEKLGVHFLRFDDREVRKDMRNVLRTIEGWVLDFEKMYNPPLPRQGGDFTESANYKVDT